MAPQMAPSERRTEEWGIDKLARMTGKTTPLAHSQKQPKQCPHTLSGQCGQPSADNALCFRQYRKMASEQGFSAIDEDGTGLAA